MDGMTTSGEAIAVSVADPQSKDAVFVPFINPYRNEKALNKRNKHIMSKSIFNSLHLDGMQDVNSALRKVLSESADSPVRRIESVKSIIECKNNKELFKKLMAEKLAKKQEVDKNDQNQQPAKKLSLKDKIAQRKISINKMNEEADRCCKCGAKNCKCEKIDENLYCESCATEIKKRKRITEGVKRLQKRNSLHEQVEAARKRISECHFEKKINENTDFSKEMEIIKAARKRHLNEARNRKLKIDECNKDEIKLWLENTVSQMLKENDGTCHSLEIAPEYCLLLKWEDGFKPNDGKFVDDKGYGIVAVVVEKDSSAMMEDWTPVSDDCSMSDDYDSIINWACEQVPSKKFNENFDNKHGNSDSVLCGIVFNDLKLTDEQYKELSKFAQDNGLEFADVSTDDDLKLVLGIDIAKNQEMSVKAVTDAIDKVSAAFFSKLEEFGIDVSVFSASTSIINVVY